MRGLKRIKLLALLGLAILLLSVAGCGGPGPNVFTITGGSPPRVPKEVRL